MEELGKTTRNLIPDIPVPVDTRTERLSNTRTKLYHLIKLLGDVIINILVLLVPQFVSVVVSTAVTSLSIVDE
jgi:hypothetical protein